MCPLVVVRVFECVSMGGCEGIRVCVVVRVFECVSVGGWSVALISGASVAMVQLGSGLFFAIMMC